MYGDDTPTRWHVQTSWVWCDGSGPRQPRSHFRPFATFTRYDTTSSPLLLRVEKRFFLFIPRPRSFDLFSMFSLDPRRITVTSYSRTLTCCYGAILWFVWLWAVLVSNNLNLHVVRMELEDSVACIVESSRATRVSFLCNRSIHLPPHQSNFTPPFREDAPGLDAL